MSIPPLVFGNMAVAPKHIDRTSDGATTRDTLGFARYVEAVHEHLEDEYTYPPITLSVEGEWGSDKSSFMKQLAKRVEEDKHAKAKVVWFNAWRRS